MSEADRTLWVNRLSKETTEEDLRNHFLNCGQIQDVLLCSSRNSNYAFVVFESNEIVRKAINEKNNSELNERELQLGFADVQRFQNARNRRESRENLQEKEKN